MFNLVVHDTPDGFWIKVIVAETGKAIAKLPWEGGDFRHSKQDYILRGPYHSLTSYRVFRLERVPAKIKGVSE